MRGRGALRKEEPVRDDDRLDVMAERFERRLSEESARTRAEIATVRVEVAGMRGEMSDRHAELLKWMLGFVLVLVTGIAGVVTLFR